jgi:hypothetical protein
MAGMIEPRRLSVTINSQAIMSFGMQYVRWITARLCFRPISRHKENGFVDRQLCFINRGKLRQ